MSNHLSEDQISRWVAGRPTTEERRHVQDCRTCTVEVDRFRSTLALFRGAVRDRADRHIAWEPPSLSAVLAKETVLFSSGTRISESESWLSSLLRQVREWREDKRSSAAPEITAAPDPSVLERFVATPSLLQSLKRVVVDTLYPARIETRVAPVEVAEIWSRDNKSRYSGLLSVFVHASIIGALTVPVAVLKAPAPTETSVMLLNTESLILNMPKTEPSRGGGGGGMNTPTPPSKGVPPRGADKQLTPPVVEIKNLNPDLIVEPTIVAPQLAFLPQFDIRTIGDPNGVVGPPSAGPGTGGGIGTGAGRGVGEGDGPGAGEGTGGGFGGGVLNVGGGVSQPELLSKVDPEYSEDGRKARATGTVELLVVVRPDGTVEFRELTKKLGFGLDQKAIDAVKKWRFVPAKRNSVPVAVFVSIVVTFTLR